MPVINKLIKKIRTCGLQKSPDPERSGPGVFITPDSTAWSIPHCGECAISRYDAVSRNTGKIVGIGNICNSFQRLLFSGPRIGVRGDLPCHTATRRVERSFRT